MSTNSDLQQINVFSKGMNTDTSDAFLSSELYRYAENLRFITEDGTSNGGELRSIEGWIEKLRTNNLSVLAMQSIRQYIILIIDGWYICSIDTSQDKWKLTYHFGPCQEPLGENISIVARWESDNNIKVYIADGIHLLMSLNIARDKSGNVKHYGTDLEQISGVLEISLPQLNASQITGESKITCPIVQYAYILYKLGGYSSNLSPLTKPIVLYKTDGGYYAGENMTSIILLTLDIENTNNADRIKVYRIGYVQNGQDPEISLIYDDVFPNGDEHDFEYTDSGFNILNVAPSEFIAQNRINFKPLLIESKNDYLFAANIQYDLQEVDDLFKNCRAVYRALQASTYTLFKDNSIDEIASNSQYVSTFKRGETYRFGIVFYDKKGRKSSVMCIDDVTIPDIDDNPTDEYWINPFYVYESSVGVDGNYIYSFEARPYKVKALVYDIPNECSGFELVRCKRGIYDTKNITQGIVGRTTNIADDNYKKNNRFAFPFMTLNHTVIKADCMTNMDVSIDSMTSDDCLMFASPEYVYQSDDVKSTLNNLKSTLLLLVKYEYNINTEPIDVNQCVLLAPSIVANATDFRVVGTHVDAQGVVNNVQNKTGSYIYKDTEYDVYKFKYGAILGTNGGLTGDYEEWGIIENINSIRNLINISEIYPTSSIALRRYLNIEIKNISYAESPNPSKFNDGQTVLIDNDKTSIGNNNFINWDAVPLYLHGAFNNSSADSLTNLSDHVYKGITAGKKCILLDVNCNHVSDDKILPITIANIVNTNVIPYGGDSDSSKNNSVFYSFGDYKDYTADITRTDTIETQNGDSYLGMFVYNSGHTWESARYHANMYPTVYIVPIESDINLKATYGDLYTNMNSPYKYWFLDKRGSIGSLTQEKDAYLYNTIYNGSYDLISYTPISYTSISNDKFDCRVHYSLIKTNGEHVDSWLNFKSADFIDVDTRYGEITDLNLFKDTLVFWQNLATGVLSVNERTMLQDVNDTNIILGNGDVLLRYDYLTTEYGMKPGLKARTQSNNALYWWDEYNKEILLYPGGNLVLPLKKVKTVSKYVNSIEEKDNKINVEFRPCLAYDNKYAEVLMSLSKDKTLVYNEYIQQFTGVYDIVFDFSTKLVDKLILESYRVLYEWNLEDYNHRFEPFAPVLKYVVNKASTATKVYDNVEFGMGDTFYLSTDADHRKSEVTDLLFDFYTPLEQHSSINKNITNREYDLRFAIPRAGGKPYGDRLRGRTMLCVLTTTDNNSNFSLQYIITKYRISHS